MSDVNISIYKDEFDKSNKLWLEQGKKDGYDAPAYIINLNDVGIDDISFENGKIFITGLSQEDSKINISLSLPIGLDVAADVLEYYIKQVNKIKTILEAAK